jgi:hypothetical protein
LGEGRGWQHAHNHLRHTRDHDGFILWVAEYRLQDGSKWITWEDLPMTRANCPTFRPRLSVIDSQNPATHLLKLVTLQVASAKEMMVKDKADSPDPRRWPLQPKRFRSRYTPHRTLTAEGNILPLSAVQEAILDVRIDVEGGIEGFKPGEDFVIQLPPVIIDVDEEKDEGRVLKPFGSDGVAEHLRKLRKNRVFLIGTPGKTIIPAIEATGVRNLDFGWITVSPVKRNARDDRMVTAGRETDIRFFGCVVDAVDFSPAGVMTLLGGQTPGLPSQRGEPQRGAWVEFYDGYFGGTEGPGFSYANQKLPYHAIPRLIFARSILDSSNDGISMYGQGMLLVESCYFYGGGGRWNVKSGNYQHRDILGQFIPMGVDLMAAAYYNNIVSMGRNLVGVNLAQRGNGSLLMYQPSCDYASEYVGNILENNGRQRGITGMHDLRCPPSRKIGTSWGYGMHIAENTIFERPIISPADGAILKRISADSVVRSTPRSALIMSFRFFAP